MRVIVKMIVMVIIRVKIVKVIMNMRVMMMIGNIRIIKVVIMGVIKVVYIGNENSVYWCFDEASEYNPRSC